MSTQSRKTFFFSFFHVFFLLPFTVVDKHFLMKKKHYIHSIFEKIMSFLELEKKDLSVYVVPGKNMNLIIEKE